MPYASLLGDREQGRSILFIKILDLLLRQSDVAQGIFLNLPDEDASASLLPKRALRIPELI